MDLQEQKEKLRKAMIQEIINLLLTREYTLEKIDQVEKILTEREK